LGDDVALFAKIRLSLESTGAIASRISAEPDWRVHSHDARVEANQRSKIKVIDKPFEVLRHGESYPGCATARCERLLSGCRARISAVIRCEKMVHCESTPF
jgi:hypothetical protein